MAIAKRAKWIEGITQSKRILRDIAEIVTTAIRDENGPIAAENWRMVYPRPFTEYPVTRGRMIQQTDTRKYIPVLDKSARLILDATTAKPLPAGEIVPETVVVLSDDKSVTYVRDTDYTYDESAKTIARIETGAIADNEEVIIEYGEKVHRILESIPVKVEKVLTIANPDREIPESSYTIDYQNRTIQFLNTPPADAAHFALTYTAVTGEYSRVEQDKLKLVPDQLDPTGQTFKLPTVQDAGDIGMYPIDTRTAAGTATGRLAVNQSGSIQYELDEINHKVKWLAGEPTLANNQTAYINVYESTNPPVNDNYALRRYQIVEDLSEPTGDIWRIVGAVNRLNEGKAHSVEIDTETTKPILFKHLSSLHAGFEEISSDGFVTDFETPTITLYQDISEDLKITFTGRGEDNLQVGLSKITDRVVLATKTEPEQEFTTVIGQDYGAVDSAKNLEMFVELIKPERLVNPETGLTRYVDHKGIQHETQFNNHYIQTRMFDRWDDMNQRPQGTIYDEDGKTILDAGAYVSDWSKYSWFKDWKEFMVDELDDDPGTSNAADGILFKEVFTQGMTDEFPIQFWLSTNNNRIAMVLMGDPTLDQDHFLTSFGYFGRVHPFYDKECVVKRTPEGTVALDVQGNPILEEKRTYFQNDVAGNFALTVGSSTLPAAIGAPPKGQPVMDAVEISTELNGQLTQGTLYDNTVYSYAVTYLTEVGESRPTPLDSGRLSIGLGVVSSSSGSGTGATTAEQGVAIKLRFRLPEEATGYRLYRYHDANTNAFASDALVHSNYKLVTAVTKLDRARTIEYVDHGDILSMYEEKIDPVTSTVKHTLIPTSWAPFYSKFVSCAPTARAFESVIRDKFTGAIIDVKFSQRFGKDTATGVNDVAMFQTRSGLKFQRHNVAFITTEEFMRKEKSGQSRWTGKFHLSPIYIEHSYDKQRGWLDGVMAVDDSGIEHLDELIVDKDTPNEEVFKFFRVNAPYSFFNNSPNYAYGLAIIKSSLKWE